MAGLLNRIAMDMIRIRRGDNSMDPIKTIWEIIKNIFVNKTTLFGIFFASSIIILLPISVIDFLGLNSFMIKYRGWISICSICSFSLWFILIIIQQLNRFRYKRRVLKALDGLSQDELFILAYCLWKGQRTIFLSMIDRGANALCSKGLLVHANQGDKTAFPFSIPDFVWKYINRNKDIIVDLDDVNVIKSFESYERRTWMSM